MADENLSALRGMTPNDGFYGPEKVENDIQERRKEKDGRGEGKKNIQPSVYILLHY